MKPRGDDAKTTLGLIADPAKPLASLAVTLLTLGNGICAFFALLAVLRAPGADGIAMAALWVFIGWVLDMLDGVAARVLKVQSSFGMMLDSLCDALSFGIVPAVMVASVVGHPVADAVAVFYLCTTLARLARFSLQTSGDSSQGHLWFQGLPSPAAGLWISAISVIVARHDVVLGDVVLLGAVVLCGALMVTRRPFADLPKQLLKGLIPWWILLPLPVLWFWSSLPWAGSVFLLGYVAFYGFAPKDILQQSSGQPRP
jgi:phosphatidylserine synthase